ncbi:MAG: type I secretion system permease/ATPase [Desulfohalobiaceae bacterium]|nr:type I secretion system permease/ATPase [Desulfohalobiaceae bacterium]
MLAFLKQFSRYFAFAGLYSMFINALYLTFPIYMLAIYVRVLDSFSFPTLYSVTLVALAALAVLGVLDFLRSRLLVQVGVEMDKRLSRGVLSEMLRKAAGVDRNQSGQALRDVNQLRNFFAGNAVFSFFDAPWVPLYLLIIYLMHPFLGLVATGGAIVLLALSLTQELSTRRDRDQAKSANIQGRNFLDKSLGNAEFVHSMGMVSGLAAHWKGVNDREVSLQDRADRKSEAFQSMSKSFRLMMQVMIFGAGAYLVLQNQTNAGIIIAASIIMGRALAPVDQALGTWKQTAEAREAYKRLRTLLQGSGPDSVTRHIEPKGDLRIVEAGFSVEEQPILRDISFELQAGEFLGIIGPNGAGKTTLCRLLLGIWPASTGQVLLDGQDIFTWDQEELGSFLGYLPQDIELFPGTVSENIARMQTPDTEKVIAAAKKAGAHETILRFAKGYETEIGPRGGNLSGGQRQRVGLARAVFGDPALVVLDEPSSNLDEAGEKALTLTLRRLKRQGTTTVMISHKPGLLSFADKILVLKQGTMDRFGPGREIFGSLARK